MDLEEIKKYRKSQAGKCLSTSHTITAREFMDNHRRLMIEFKEFTVDYKDNMVKITIPMGI